MNPVNHNFIKNRSLEIAWAVFRCAALFKQENLKMKTENIAVDLVALSHNFQKREEDAKEQLNVLSQLEILVKLAEVLEEINIINAQVLFREINNLTWAVQNALSEIKQSLQIKPEHPDIESIFSSSRQKSKETSANKLPEETKEIVEINEEKFLRQTPLAVDEKDWIDDNYFSGNKETKNSKSVRRPSSGAVAVAAGLDIKTLINKRKSALMENSAAIRQNSDVFPLDTADSWQSVIFNKIKEVEKISARELIAALPQISERTVRFYLQKLTDSGLIKRIGNPGPGSYYMLS